MTKTDMNEERDYGKSDALEEALSAALEKAREVGNAYWRYDEIMTLRRELNTKIDFMLSELIDNLDVC